MFGALRPYKWQVAAVIVLQLVQVIASLLLPNMHAKIVDDGIVAGDMGYIWNAGGIMLVIAAAQVLTSIAAIWFSSTVAMSVGRDLRSQVFRKIQTFSTAEISKFGPPTLITRNTNDVNQVQMLVQMSLMIMVTAPLMLFGGVAMAIGQDPALSTLLVFTVPAVVIIIALTMWRMTPHFERMQKRIDRINLVLREQIAGVRVIRAFVAERRENARFEEANDRLFDTSLSVGRIMALLFPLFFYIISLTQVAVVWISGIRVEAGDMQIGAMSAFLTYLMFIMSAIMMSSFMLMMIPRAGVSAGRIAEVLNTDPTVLPPAQPVDLPEGPLSVVADGVTFGYPDADDDVLHEVSFEARPGSTTAIIGSTGSGKSTLVRLLPRLADPTGGELRLGGVPLHQLRNLDLVRAIGYVPQTAYLFSGTIADNLRYGKPEATEEDMWRALRLAAAEDFVRGLADGLDSEVESGGTNFSGGQRQRLAIARAIVGDPKVYVFDDSFSALDYATDARVRRNLEEVAQNAVVLIVAQRVSTIAGAEQILVLEHGRIVGRGTDEELRATCQTYQEIVDSQAALAQGGSDV